VLDQKSDAIEGPIVTADGVHLLLLGETKAASPFEEIAAEVEKAARREFQRELRRDKRIERKI
jgi:parvulin-like peptidyl-prolyl isomerase